ncbi:hypothetical protein [Thalassobellus suaedae]|uniref:Uncharacterized protein n=1 Tax=Thalassobellus suaedae TaxID=3074124 RepID=A0ABY9Y6K4_9FLAO|nr:hypothetical protein RHP49_06490 [Flavobacteriaceae bacterium HL-DH10]
MKNVIKNTKKGILMVTMFVTLLSFANERSFTIKNDANRTSLTFYNVKEGNLLSIKDDNGIILYKELIQEQGTYSKGFDLTSLPDDNYIFELEKDMEIETIPFTVKSSVVEFDKEEGKIIFKPFTRVVGNLVYLTQLALNDESFKVNIYYSNSNFTSDSELVYSEKIENTKDIKRVYKLVGLYKGNYKIVCNLDDRIFTKFIN